MAPARLLRIVPTDTADEMDAFCSELIGITMGTRVAEGLPYHITLYIYSDCMAAIARSHTAFAPRPKAMGHLRNVPICDILCQQSLVMNRLIKWIKSHPEKLKKMVNFAYEDWGSYFADAAAEGEWNHLPQAKIHTVYLEDIMDEILPMGCWHWRDECGKLVMSGIKDRVARRRGDKYNYAREDKRAAEG
jgi:hypothetical protein